MRLGMFEAHVDTMFASMWSAAKIKDPATISRSQELDMKTWLLACTRQAMASSVFGSRTFFRGNEMLFGKEWLGELEGVVIAKGTFMRS